jgi:hypothetical protein
MERVGTAIRSTITRLHRVPAAVARAGRVPLALGAALLIGSTVTVWATTNTPPQLTSLTIDHSVINEGQTVTISGAFTDPDPADLHSVLIYWGDVQPGQAEHIRLALGARSFQVPHTYADDLPLTSLKVVVVDHQLPFGTNDNTTGIGRDTGHVSIQVKNVPPTFAPGVTVTGPNGKTGFTTIDGTVIDPGTDRVAVGVNWGDGSIPPPSLPPLPGNAFPCTVDKGRHFHCEHTYNVQPFFPPHTYDVKVIARDDDGGAGLFATTLHTP